MRILIFTQGAWGERLLRNIKAHSPADWTIASATIPPGLPAVIEDPLEYITQDLPQTDLLVFLSQSPQAPQLIPDLAVMTKASAVLAPIDNTAWMPPGLKNQIKRDLARMGIPSAFPKTFCTLTETGCGYPLNIETYESEVITAFAKRFGRPKLRITVNPKTGNMDTVEIERFAPCGATHHAIRKFLGTPADRAVPSIGLISMQFPCLGSMAHEAIPHAPVDTLMHLSGHILNEAISEQLSL